MAASGLPGGGRLDLRQLAFRFPHRARQRLQDFLPTPCNRKAYEGLLSWPDWPHFTCLLVGPPASGRTHLARIWCELARAPLVRGAELAAVQDPLAWLGSHRALAVDDADQVAEARRLLELHNLLRERGGHLLLTARRPAAAWPEPLPDLRSRLLSAFLLTIEPPDDAILEMLLIKQSLDRGLLLPPDVVRFLAVRMERSFTAVRALVDTLDRLSLAAKRPVSLATARAALGELAGAPPQS